MASRAEMNEALRVWVVPSLREQGFSGSMPNFRRNCGAYWDLFSFTFHRDGGALILTLARCLATGIDDPMGFVPAKKARPIDRHINHRKDVGVSMPEGGDIWFRYRHLRGLVTLCKAIRNRASDASIWVGVTPNGSEVPYQKFGASGSFSELFVEAKTDP
jgi:hypothetical protein